MNGKKRIVFHLDMDQFFAAVEEREHPEFRGKPVIVGADPKGGKGRGVVSTCNYRARQFGVRSGMPISTAWRLCPDAVFRPVDYELYAKVSNEIMAMLRGYADKFEQWGIDEAFMDVSLRVKDFDEAEALALRIKRDILEREKLTCSIGISSNKLVAKIASDFHKPDGLTVVRGTEIQEFLAPLSARRLLWVGRKTGQKLAEMGIKTIGDLARYDPTVLVEAFGAMGTQLYLMAQGIDESEVEERGAVKSVSRDVTFEEDTDDFERVLDTLDSLSEDVYKDLSAQHFLFKTVTVKVRYENFETHTRSRTLPFLTNRLQDLQKTAKELARHYLVKGRKVRLVSVKASSLVLADKQRTLA